MSRRSPPSQDQRALLARLYEHAQRGPPRHELDRRPLPRRGDGPGRGGPLARRRPVAGDDRPKVLQDLLRLLQPKKRAPAPPPAASGWGQPVELGGTMQVRAREGFRPAVVQVRPGLHIVAEVPRQSTEVGVFPLVLLAPAIAKAVAKAAKKKGAGERDIPVSRPASPAAPTPRWLDDEDLDELGIDIGAEEIAACACQRRRAGGR